MLSNASDEHITYTSVKMSYLIACHSPFPFRVVWAQHTFSCFTSFWDIASHKYIQYLEHVHITYKTYQAKFPSPESRTIPLVRKGKTWKNAQHPISCPKCDLIPIFNYKATQIFNTPSMATPAKRSHLQPKNLPNKHKTKTNTRVLQQFC